MELKRQRQKVVHKPWLAMEHPEVQYVIYICHVWNLVEMASKHRGIYSVGPDGCQGQRREGLRAPYSAFHQERLRWLAKYALNYSCC